MNYLKVTNWEKLQQYKDRDPKWIKVYRELLEDYEFSKLSDTSKFHVVGLWLLAAKLDNKIPNDAGWIKTRINATKAPDLQLLIQSGFIEPYGVIQKAVQSCTEMYPETEAEAEGETEKRQSVVQEFFAYWNSKENLQKVRSLTPKRAMQLKKRLSEGHFESNWQAVIDKISDSSFCTGENSNGWKVSFDWIIKNQDNYTKVLEGNYDNRKAVPAGQRKSKVEAFTGPSAYGITLGGPDKD